MIDVRSSTRRIYLASSWRNKFYADVHDAIADAGHAVYDFKHPAPGNNGFAWAQVDPDWLTWTPERYIEKIRLSPEAARGFSFDQRALDWCDTCVLLLPSGRSAHIEAGYAIGRGKYTIIYLRPEGFEPELMYLLADRFVTDNQGLIEALQRR